MTLISVSPTTILTLSRSQAQQAHTVHTAHAHAERQRASSGRVSPVDARWRQRGFIKAAPSSQAAGQALHAGACRDGRPGAAAL